MRRLFAVAFFSVLLTAGATGLIAAEGHNPENNAQESDLVIHGTVTGIAGSGEVDEHHPVQLDVKEVFKGKNTDSVTIQVKGTEKTYISTAASFEEGEEVIAMLEERENRYYMTTGYAAKYEVQNSSIRLLEPERENITVNEMKSIVENSTSINNTEENNSSPEKPGKPGKNFLNHVLDFLTDLF